MKAGRELDALVALEIMGEPRPTVDVPEGVLDPFYTVVSEGGNWVGTTTGYMAGDEPVWIPRPFSTDISPGWEVIRAMMADNWWPSISSATDGVLWTCTMDTADNEDAPFWGHGETAPEAICLAALRAVGVKILV